MSCMLAHFLIGFPTMWTWWHLQRSKLGALQTKISRLAVHQLLVAFRIPQLLTCLVRNEGKLIMNLLSQVGRMYPQAVYFPIRTLYLTLKIEQRERRKLLLLLLLLAVESLCDVHCLQDHIFFLSFFFIGWRGGGKWERISVGRGGVQADTAMKRSKCSWVFCYVECSVLLVCTCFNDCAPRFFTLHHQIALSSAD